MSPEQVRGPISPSEAKELQTHQIPDEVFIAFNGLIAQNLYRGRARVMQRDVVDQLEAQGLKRDHIFSKHWLDVEQSYQEAGWKVTYDKPAYNESYEPSFEFVDANKPTANVY